MEAWLIYNTSRYVRIGIPRPRLISEDCRSVFSL